MMCLYDFYLKAWCLYKTLLWRQDALLCITLVWRHDALLCITLKASILDLTQTEFRNFWESVKTAPAVYANCSLKLGLWCVWDETGICYCWSSSSSDLFTSSPPLSWTRRSLTNITIIANIWRLHSSRSTTVTTTSFSSSLSSLTPASYNYLLYFPLKHWRSF